MKLKIRISILKWLQPRGSIQSYMFEVCKKAGVTYIFSDTSVHNICTILKKTCLHIVFALSIIAAILNTDYLLLFLIFVKSDPLMRNIPFEPSRELKKMFLSTRKEEVTYGGFTHPGLFNTYNYSKDSWFFFLAILLEIVGLGLIIHYGNFEAGNAALIAFVAVILDLAFAYVHHLPQKSIQNHKISLVLEDDEKQLERVEGRLKSAKRIKSLLILPLVILAGLKIFVFYVVYHRVDVILIAVIVSYIVVAAIHILNTGYFFSELFRKRKEVGERKTYLDESNKVANFEARRLQTEFNPNVKVAYIDNETFGLVPSNENSKVEIFSHGILYDAQLQQIIDKQDKSVPTAAYEVARVGLKHQYKVVLENQPVVR